jgi:uncharacterized protein (TIGR03437 family)
MSRGLCVALLVCFSVGSHAQSLPFPTFIAPKVLHVGSAATSVSVSNQDYTAGLTALWNGSPRATSQSNSFGYNVQLTAADMAVPQLATLSMIDSGTGRIVDSVTYPVGFDVQPTGIALDNTQSRLYLATNSHVGDAQLPPNSVVIFDLKTGKAAGSVQIGSRLGDVAISDDGSALYVALDALGVVRRFDPATLATVADFKFRAATSAGADDMLSVMPGHPGTVALSFAPNVGSSETQIAIFDNGVKRISTIGIGCCGYLGLMFSPDGKYLFVNGSTPAAGGTFLAGTLRCPIDATGILPPSVAAGGAPVAFIGNTLFTAQSATAISGGSFSKTIDYPTMRVNGNFGIVGPTTADASTQRAFVLYTPSPFSSSGATLPPMLVAFAIPSLEAMGAQTIGESSITNLKESEKLLRFGIDGFVIPAIDGLLIFHTPLAQAGPVTASNAIVNAASQQRSPVAPGEIVSIYGTNLGPATAQGAVNAGAAFPSILSNVQVLFGNTPGIPLLAYSGLINVVAPFDLVPGTTVNAQVLYYGIPSAKVPLSVVAAAPALFTKDGSGRGQAAVINQDGTIDTPSPRGTFVTLYGTGGGIFPGAEDGGIPRRASQFPGTVRVSLASRDAQVFYAGAAPGLVSGAFQLNVAIPADMATGPAEIIVNVQGNDSPRGVTLEIR